MRDTIIPPLRAIRTVTRRACVVSLLAIACALGGCASGGPVVGSFALAGSGATVAFESIDGPPPQVFDRMVSVLDSESKLRNLSIVSREGARLVPGAKLSRRRGQPRPHHHRMGLGRL